MSRNTVGKWLACILILGLVACGGGGDDSPRPGKPKKEEEELPKTDPTIESVEIAPRDFELEVGETRQLIALVKGEGEFDITVSWSTSDESVATVVDGLVTAIAEGEATITARSNGDETKSGSATVTVLPETIPIPIPEFGALRVVIEDLPEGVKAGVQVEGPEGFETTVDETGLLEELAVGTYTLTATELEDETYRYLPTPKSLTVEVEAEETAEATIAYGSQLLSPFTMASEGAVLPQHGAAKLEVTLTRAEEFEGPVELALEGLPMGVTAEPVSLPADETSAVFELEADGTTRTIGVHGVEIRGVAGELEVVAQAELEIVARVTSLDDIGPGTLRYYLELAPELTVLDEGPLTITFDNAFGADSEIPVDSTLRVTSNVVIEGKMAGDLPAIHLQGNGNVQLMHVTEEVEAVIRGLEFRNGWGNEGGALMNEGKLEIHDAVFFENDAMVGGAIWNAGALRIEGSEISWSDAPNAGAIFNGGELHVVRSHFGPANVAHEKGGAILNDEGATLTLSATSFNLNTALEGGAVYSADATLEIADDCEFTENVGHEKGGALYLHLGTTTISNADIAWNQSNQGAGIYVGVPDEHEFQQGELTLDLHDARFFGNIAYDEGGGIFSHHARIRVTDSRFEEDFAELLGGGMSLRSGEATLVDTEFLNNDADEGGAIISSAELEMEGGRIEGAIDGGGLVNIGNAVLRAVTIQGNEAIRGAGIRNEGEVTIEACAILQNEAYLGGGIYSSGVLTIFNSTIGENKADEGGGIYVEASILHLRQSTVSKNEALDGAGGGIFSEASAIIERSIVAHNGAFSGAEEIFSTGSGTASAGYNLFGNLAGSNVTPSDTDLVDEDPRLFDPHDNGGPTPTMALDELSPAIDKIPADKCEDLKGLSLLVDQRGEPRPAGTHCDIGAFELQP